MSGLIVEYNQSGLSIKAFCQLKQIGYHTFQYWRYREKRLSQKQTGFAPLRTTPRQLSHGKVTVSYQNGVSVSIDFFDSGQIMQLLQLGNV